MLTLALARVRFGDSILGAEPRRWRILLFLPIGVLGRPALGFGRSRFSLLLGQGNVEPWPPSLREHRPAASLGADDLGRAPAARRRGRLAVAGAAGGDRAGALSSRRSSPSTACFRPAGSGCASRTRAGARERVWRSAATARGRATGWADRRPAAEGLAHADARPALADRRTGQPGGARPAGHWSLFAGDPFARTAHGCASGSACCRCRTWRICSAVSTARRPWRTRAATSRCCAPRRSAWARVLLAKVLGGLVLVMAVTWAATLALALSHGGEPLETGAALAAATWLALGATRRGGGRRGA